MNPSAPLPLLPRRVASLLPAFALAAAMLGCSPAGSGATGVDSDAGVTSGAVTFHRDIEPVLQKRCQSCHSPGHIAPFSLVSYDEARGAAGLMVQQTRSHAMPPWGAVSTPDCQPRFGWKDDMRLQEAEIALFEKWVADGVPEGDPKDAPAPFMPPPAGLPDMQIEMAPVTSFISSGTNDQFQCFVMDPGFTRPAYLNGWHFVAGNTKVVHHALMFVTADPTSAAMVRAKGGATGSYPCFGGPGPGIAVRLVGAWAPGVVPAELPPDVATTVQPGSVMVMQIHYHPAGLGNQPDATRFQMRFLAAPPAWQLVTTLIGNFATHNATTGDGLQPDENGKVQFLIPANSTKVLDQVFTLPPTIGGTPLPELRLLQVGAHMHYVGRDMRISVVRGPTITNGDPPSECLLETPSWDFNWQRGYAYDTALDNLPRLHAGDKLMMRCVYDNTLRNPFVAEALKQQGLDQPRDVHLGESTLDEMCLGVFGTIFKN